MDWNLNAPTEWDWENLAKNLPFSTQESSNVDFSCFSASADSSSKETIKTFGVFDDLPKDFLENGSLEEANSVVSGEAMIGLKLMGNCCSSSNNNNNNNNNNNKTDNMMMTAALFPTKRSRASYFSSQSPRCQVEGCNLDLASAKDYHRRHRICANHSKSPKVIVAGMERRFCQQCSRFHDLSEFDDRKRSCRRRLSAHNARRRRPQSEEIHFSSSTRMSPSLSSEGRPHMNYVLNRRSMPVDPGLPESSCNFKGKGQCLLGLAEGAGIDGLPAKGAFNFGSERFTARNTNHNGMDVPSNSVLVPGDVKTAFSLLSTTGSWSSSTWPVHVQPSSFDHHLAHATTTTLPIPSELQNTDLQDCRSLPHQFQRFHFN